MWQLLVDEPPRLALKAQAGMCGCCTGLLAGVCSLYPTDRHRNRTVCLSLTRLLVPAYPLLLHVVPDGPTPHPV